MADKMNISILEDGTVRVETEGISQANHYSADEFLQMIERLAGGEVQSKAKEGHTTHTHGKLIHSH